jgi:hypothetical protein
MLKAGFLVFSFLVTVVLLEINPNLSSTGQSSLVWLYARALCFSLSVAKHDAE